MTTDISSTQAVDNQATKLDSKRVTVVFVLGGPGSGMLFHSRPQDLEIGLRFRERNSERSSCKGLRFLPSFW